MDKNASKSSRDGRLEPCSFDPVIALLIPKPKMTIIDKLEQNTDETQDKGCCLGFDNACCSILGRWWNVRYKLQRGIIRFVEKPLFHIAIIVLVLIDCLLVITELILDFIKLKKPCGSKTINHDIGHGAEDENHRIEMIVEILHFSSLALLAVFLLEVLVKVYAFGRHWWNFHQKKMEWLDAIIVIVSFAVDLASLHKSNVFVEISLLFISLRLWRFIRIINCVAQTIRSEDETKKKHLVTSYHELLELLLTISEKKTAMISELGCDMIPEDFDSIIEKFQTIDQSCRTIIEHHPHLSSLKAATEMAHHLQDTAEKLRLTSLTMCLPTHNVTTSMTDTV